MQSSFSILRIARLQRLSRLYTSIPPTTSTTRRALDSLSSIASHTHPFSVSISYGVSEQNGSPDPLILTEEQKVADVELLKAILENLKVQQIKLDQIRVATNAAVRIFLGEEQKARKRELKSAMMQNRVEQVILRDKIRAAAEIEKDSQQVIDLRTELRNLKFVYGKQIRDIKALGPREKKDKESVLSSEDEENLSI